MRVSARLAAISLGLALALPACATPDQDGAGSEPGASISGLSSRVELVNDWLGSSDRVEIRWTLTNEGLETVWLPSWDVPDAAIENDLFDVALDGQEVEYVGRVYKRAEPIASDLVAIEPGHELSAVIDLSRLYRTSTSGEYTIAYRAMPEHVFDVSLAREVRSNQVLAVRFEDAPELTTPFVLTPGFTSCTTSRQSSIKTSLDQADSYAASSLAYLNAGTTGKRYTTWFGTYTSSRYATVKSHFTKIRDVVANKKINFNCGCTDSAYAYVYPNQPYNVYLCNAFWSAPTAGTDSKAGTIIHELSHFTVVAGTDDHGYGQSKAKSLAISQPSKAVDNADNHEYFAENTPFQN